MEQYIYTYICICSKHLHISIQTSNSIYFISIMCIKHIQKVVELTLLNDGLKQYSLALRNANRDNPEG